MLETILKEYILTHGAMRLDDYMAACLYDPDHGYYRTHDPLGAAGDFTTSPEISQLFGEIIGAWIIAQWHQMGSPKKAALVELGPGRGTLMADILRTIRTAQPAMLDAIDVHLVEINEVLQAKQREALKSYSMVHWHADISALPELPMLLVANEFFDALPIRQFRHTGEAWEEKHVGVKDDKLVWVWAVSAINHPPSSLYETSPATHTIMEFLAQRIVRHGGAGLIIDYGYTEGSGDSFQAMHRHGYADPLISPGTADLTAHVDFAALSNTAKNAGAAAYGAVTQGEWLRQLHIELRAALLCKKATPSQQAKILADVHRLTTPEAMGSLFRCLAITHPSLPKPEGF